MHGSIQLALPFLVVSALHVGRGQQDRRLPAEPLDELTLCYAVNVALELDEDLKRSFGIERIAIRIEELRQGLAGDGTRRLLSWWYP